jgi:hypothetical protein
MLKIEDARALVKSGKAEAALKRFIIRTLKASPVFELPDVDYQETDDTLVAALALVEMMDSADGRAAIGLKRKPRGATFDAAYFHRHKSVIEAVRRHRHHQLGQDALIDVLDNACENFFGKRPNMATLARMLDHLDDYVAILEKGYLESIHAVHRVAGLPLDEAIIQTRLDQMFQDAYKD